MRRFLLFSLVVLILFVTGCIKLPGANEIRGTVFTDEYIENAVVKVFDVEGGTAVEGEFLTDEYGRFTIPVPQGLKFPVVILATFDVEGKPEKTDALASVVEKSFYTEQILVNPVSSVFTAYMFRQGINFKDAVEEVREALNVPPEINVLSRLYPGFETSYFSMERLASFVRDYFGGVYKDFIETVVEAIAGGARYNFGVGATAGFDLATLGKDLFCGIASGIAANTAYSSISWVLKNLFGLGDQTTELINEILNQIQEVNAKLDTMSEKLDTIDSEIQSILTKLDQQYYDSYVRMVDQNYFTPIEICNGKYLYITTLPATTSTDLSIESLMQDIWTSKLDQVMLNIKKVIVGGTADTSYMSLFEIYMTNAMNSLRAKKLIDEPTEDLGFYKRCSPDSPEFIEYIQAYIALFKALTTRQLLALNLLVEYEHKKGTSLAELHLQNYTAYIEAEVEVFWHWLEVFITYALGGESLMSEPLYDPDKAWFFNEADNVALKALGKDSGIVVRVFWNTQPMDFSVAGSTELLQASLKTALGYLTPAFNIFKDSSKGVKVTLDKQEIQLTGVDEAIEAKTPLGDLRFLNYTHQDVDATVEPEVVMRRYIFENLEEGRYSISRSTNSNIVQAAYTHTLLENAHKNIANNLFIADEYLSESNYALNICAETSHVQSLAISAYMPSMRINNLEREMTYGRDPAGHDYVGVLNYALNRYMKISDESYWDRSWILFIPTWDSYGVDLVKVNGTDRFASGRYSCRLILTNKGDKGTGDSWGWQQGTVTKDHTVWLRALSQLSDMCLAPHDLSKYYSIDKKDDKYKMLKTTFCLYLNHDTAYWDLLVEPTAINVLGTLFGGDKLYYGELVRLKNVKKGTYVSYNKIYTSSSSYYNCGALNDSNKYMMSNWWVFYR